MSSKLPTSTKLSRIALLVMLIGSVAIVGSAAADPNLPGSGTESDPYEISNVTELQMIDQDLTANYTIVNDIDGSPTQTWSGGFSRIAAGTEYGFEGSIDGNNHTISDLYVGDIHLITQTSQSEIKNIKLKNLSMPNGEAIINQVQEGTTIEHIVVKTDKAPVFIGGTYDNYYGLSGDVVVDRIHLDYYVSFGNSHLIDGINPDVSGSQTFSRVSVRGVSPGGGGASTSGMVYKGDAGTVRDSYSLATVANTTENQHAGLVAEPTSSGGASTTVERSYFAGEFKNFGGETIISQSPYTNYVSHDNRLSDNLTDSSNSMGLNTTEMIGSGAKQNMSLDTGLGIWVEDTAGSGGYPKLQWEVDSPMLSISVTEDTSDDGSTDDGSTDDGSTDDPLGGGGSGGSDGSTIALVAIVLIIAALIKK